jgi:hypothetical protein
MSKSKLGNKHYFIFQHRDLLWSWSISNEELENHKHKVLPHSEKNKQLGVDKITNAFSDYYSDDMEMKVYNGCIEHAFALKGDITQKDERVHWLFISNGEKGRFLELDELEERNFQISYLSNSFGDDKLPNVELLSKWIQYEEAVDEDDETTDDEKGSVYGVRKTILHLEVLQRMLRECEAHLTEGLDKLTDERDVFLFNDCFNNTMYHINKVAQSKQLKKDMDSLGAEELHTSLVKSCESTFKLSSEVYGDKSLYKHIQFSWFVTLDRKKRNIVRNDVDLLDMSVDIINDAQPNMEKMVTILKEIETK